MTLDSDELASNCLSNITEQVRLLRQNWTLEEPWQLQGRMDYIQAQVRTLEQFVKDKRKMP